MIIRPTRHELLLQTAELWAHRSTCVKPNGAVLSREGKIISIGYNGAVSGQQHCLDQGCEPGPDGACLRTAHAEANSIIMAARFGIATEGVDLHCTSSPCYTCAKLIINAGIVRVVYRHEYRLPEGVQLLRQANIRVIHQPARLTLDDLGKE